MHSHLSRGSGISTRRGTSLSDLGTLDLLLVNALGEQLSVLGSSVLLGLSVAELEGTQVTLALQSLRGDETLDLGSLGEGLVALGDLAADDVLADIVLLGEAEELADVVGTLGTKTLGDLGVGQTLNVLLTLLDNNKREDSEIGADNAATDRLALALTSAARSVARVALGKEQTDTGGVQNTLLHGETLLVVTASDLEDVALELIADSLAIDLLAHTLVVEDTNAVLVVDLDELLGTVSRVCNVKLMLVSSLCFFADRYLADNGDNKLG